MRGNHLRLWIAFGILFLAWLVLLGKCCGQCPCDVGGDVCACNDCECGMTYDAAWTESIKQNKPLIVFVKQKAQKVPGCLSCRWDQYPGQGVAGVVIGLPDGAGAIDEVAKRDSYPPVAWITTRVGEIKQARAAVQQRRETAPLSSFRPAAPVFFGGGSMGGGCRSGG